MTTERSTQGTQRSPRKGRNGHISENIDAGAYKVAECIRALPDRVLSGCWIFSAHAIVTRDSRSTTGNFFIDEEVLRSRGVEDFGQYAVNPGARLFDDLFPD